MAEEETKPPPWTESKFAKNVTFIFPFIRWIIVFGSLIFSAGLGYYVYQRDTNQQQAINVSEIQKEQIALRQSLTDYKIETEKQFQLIRAEMLTRELAKSWRDADVERMIRIEKALDAIENRSVRP